MLRPYCFSAVVILSLSTLACAEVTRIEITGSSPYAGGRAMAGRGAYEQLRGTAHFAVDPAAESNKIVVDLDLAPRNADGKVEFSADIEMLVPVDRSQANGAMFYEVNNRGGKTATATFLDGADEFLLRNGYIIVWSGWIAEVQPEQDKLRLKAPVPTEAGKPLRGVVRGEFVLDRPSEEASISHRSLQGSFRPSVRGDAEARLTRRVREQDPRETVRRELWKFIVNDVPGGQLPVVKIKLDGGLQPGVIYEVVYEAEGSIVQGAGMAGIRDLLSFLKHNNSADNPLAVDGRSVVSRAIGFGTSQSGRLLRQFLYDGFNGDQQGRIVFDGVIPHVAGGGLGFFNHRFSSPTRTNDQHDEHLFPADYFPFTYGDERDPFAGQLDGILKKCRLANTVPKVMHTQSSSEYWHRSGSLVHTDPLGQHDAEIPPEVRIYAFGGTQHGAGSGLPVARGAGQLPSNSANYRPLLRGLLTAMDAWIVDGTAPPASVYPKISDNTLANWQEQQSGWQAIPGVHYPQVIQQPSFLDRGPEWATFRRASIEPPIIKGNYVTRVPAYGLDNNEIGCLMIPAVAVPVATYGSWNLRHESVGAEGELLALQGSYIPLLRTRAEREKSGDPRLSLIERYGDFATYQQRFAAAASKLVSERYLLAEDLPRELEFCQKMRPLFEP